MICCISAKDTTGCWLVLLNDFVRWALDVDLLFKLQFKSDLLFSILSYLMKQGGCTSRLTDVGLSILAGDLGGKAATPALCEFKLPTELIEVPLL